MNRPLLALLFAAGTLPAAAASTIYRCTDENGGTLISNAKVDKSCRAVASGAESNVPAPKIRSAAANPSPAGFPRVGEDTQKARDSDRRRILEDELASERKGLDQARKDLAEQEAVRAADEHNSPRGIERLQPYKERIALHERNIEAINKELANLR